MVLVFDLDIYFVHFLKSRKIPVFESGQFTDLFSHVSNYREFIELMVFIDFVEHFIVQDVIIVLVVISVQI